MGSGDWFRTIITRMKAKQNKSRLTEGKGKESRKISNRTNVESGGLTAEAAATKIQTSFRAYMGRKELRRLKGIVRCRNVMKEICIENQQQQQPSVNHHIQFWTKIQEEIKGRRLYMVTEGRLQHKKLQNKRKLEAKLQELEEDWCGGSETMEEIIQRIQHREEAAVKRERAMAYAFSHQWRANSGQYFGHAYYDIGKDSWGWSWKERWIAIRPWEIRVKVNSKTNIKKIQSKKEDYISQEEEEENLMKIFLTVKPTPPLFSQGKKV